MIYRAEFEHRMRNIVHGGSERHMILFTAEDDLEAIKGAAAWWICWHNAVPEIFELVYSITIRQMEPQPIQADGFLAGESGRMVFQWKASTGLGPGVAVGAKTLTAADISPLDWPGDAAFNRKNGFASLI